MTGDRGQWPEPAVPADIDPNTVCLSVDVEWSTKEVLEDLVRLFDERGLKATFFVTHAGVSVPGHERGIHPNYRADGEVRRALAVRGDEAPLTEQAMYEGVVASFKGFAPEAKGARGHSLHYDSRLLAIYNGAGIEYDSTYQMPLVQGIAPHWKEYDILELPIFFNDFFELKTGALGFDALRLNLEAPGLKVIDIHPNTMFINASSLDHYEASRKHYKDPDGLLRLRHEGKGVRTLVIGLMDRLASGRYATATIGEINTAWRDSRSR